MGPTNIPTTGVLCLPLLCDAAVKSKSKLRPMERPQKEAPKFHSKLHIKNMEYEFDLGSFEDFSKQPCNKYKETYGMENMRKRSGSNSGSIWMAGS